MGPSIRKKLVKWLLLTILLFYGYLHLSEKTNQQLLVHEKVDSTTNCEDLSRTELIMKALRKSDQQYTDVIEALNVNDLTEEQAKEKFYEIVQKPVQGVCRTLKRLGGYWFKGRGALDGDKFICFDDIRPEQCLVYSFGINNIWTFEDLIAEIGCNVWSYDPSHSAPEKRGERIQFESVGLSDATQDNMATLDHLRQKNGHSGQTITYLKADVEGAEMRALPHWIMNGTLDTVDQFALELHMKFYHDPPRFKWFLTVLQDLHRLKFRIISYEANLAAGKEKGFYQFMEMVWMKDTVWNYLD